MAGEYSDCYFCGGEVQEQRITREIWWRRKLYLIEDVPVGVCRQCGQKVVLPQVAKAIDRMLAGQVLPDDFVEVPTYRFREVEAVS